MVPLVLGQPAAACRASQASAPRTRLYHPTCSSRCLSRCPGPLHLPQQPLPCCVSDGRAGRYTVAGSRRLSTVRRYRDGAQEPAPDTPPPSGAEGGPLPPAAATPPGLVPLTFRLGQHVSWGQGVALVGGSWALGDWDPAQALRLKWGEGDVWSATAALPPGRTIHFKYIIVRADSGALVAWGEELKGGAGGNLQLRVSPDGAAPGGYTLEVLPAHTPGTYPFLSVEVDTAALHAQQQAQQQTQQQHAQGVEGGGSQQAQPATGAGGDSTSHTTSPTAGAQGLPEDTVAAVAALESLADDEMQLLRSQGSPEDSPVASAESAGEGLLDAGDDIIGLNTGALGGAGATPMPDGSSSSSSSSSGPQQQATGLATAGPAVVEDDGDTEADVLGSGVSAKQGVALDRADPPDPALLAAEAVGDDAGGDEEVASPAGATPGDLASQAAAAGITLPVTSSSDEEVLDPEVLALVNALWDSTPTPCDPEVDFQLTGEEGLAAWNTSLDDATDDLRAAAAARLGSMDGTALSSLTSTGASSSTSSSNSSVGGGPDLGPLPGLSGDVSPTPADVEVAEAAPGVQLKHPGDTQGVTGDGAVPVEDGFTAAAAAAMEARLAGQQQQQQEEEAPQVQGRVGGAQQADDTAEGVQGSKDAAAATIAAAPAGTGTGAGAGAGAVAEPPSDATHNALLTLSVLAAAVGRLRQLWSPPAAPKGAPAPTGTVAGDVAGSPGATTTMGTISNSSSLDGGAEVAAGAAAAAGVPASDVVAAGDAEELWGSRDEVVLPPEFYKGVVGGSVDGWAADKYPTITAASAGAGGAAGGGEGLASFGTIDVTDLAYTMDDGDARSSISGADQGGAGPAWSEEGPAGVEGQQLGVQDSQARDAKPTPAAASTKSRKLVAVDGPDLYTLDLEARLGEGVLTGAVTDVSPDTLEPLDPIITDEVALPGLVPGCVGLDQASGENAAAATSSSSNAGSDGSNGEELGAGDAAGDTSEDMEEGLRAAMRRRAAWGMGDAEAQARLEQPELMLVSAEEEGAGSPSPGDDAAGDAALGGGVRRGADQGQPGAADDAAQPPL